MKTFIARAASLLAIMAVMSLVLVPVGAKPTTKTAEDAAKMVLKLKFPKPMFVGTPKDIKSANLEKKPMVTPKAISVPVGTVNLATKKDVTASDEEPIIGEIKLVNDADKEGSDGSYVEFGPGPQYVQIDLGKKADIYAIMMWHYHAQARVYHDVVIRIAEDEDFITGVKTIYNNDHDNSAGLGVGKDKEYIETSAGRLVKPKTPVQGQFIRFYSNGNTTNELNHYIEVEVFGK